MATVLYEGPPPVRPHENLRMSVENFHSQVQIYWQMTEDRRSSLLGNHPLFLPTYREFDSLRRLYIERAVKKSFHPERDRTEDSCMREASTLFRLDRTPLDTNDPYAFLSADAYHTGNLRFLQALLLSGSYRRRSLLSPSQSAALQQLEQTLHGATLLDEEVKGLSHTITRSITAAHTEHFLEETLLPEIDRMKHVTQSL